MPPDQQKFQRAKANIIRNLTTIINDSEDLLSDLESWNANRTECQPFDVGGTKLLIRMAKALLERVEREEPCAKEYERFVAQAEAMTHP